MTFSQWFSMMPTLMQAGIIITALAQIACAVFLPLIFFELRKNNGQPKNKPKSYAVPSGIQERQARRQAIAQLVSESQNKVTPPAKSSPVDFSASGAGVPPPPDDDSRFQPQS